MYIRGQQFFFVRISTTCKIVILIWETPVLLLLAFYRLLLELNVAKSEGRTRYDPFTCILWKMGEFWFTSTLLDFYRIFGHKYFGITLKIQKWRENIRHFLGLAYLLKKPKKYLDRWRLWNISTFFKLSLDVALPKKYLIKEEFFEIRTFCLVKLKKIMRKWKQ